MKKFTYPSLLIASLFLLVSFVMVDGSDTRNLGDFDELSVSGGISVTLIHGNNNKAEIETEGIEASEVLTEISGGKLKIKLKKQGLWGKKKKVDVTLHYQDLKAVSVSSGASLTAENTLESSDLEVDVSSGASCQLEVECTELSVEVSSGASVRLSGKCSSQTVDVSSGASYKAESMSSTSASVKASSGANAKVWVSDNLTAKASSGGSVRYKGEPKSKNIDKNYSGSVKKA